MNITTKKNAIFLSYCISAIYIVFLAVTYKQALNEQLYCIDYNLVQTNTFVSLYQAYSDKMELSRNHMLIMSDIEEKINTLSNNNIVYNRIDCLHNCKDITKDILGYYKISADIDLYKLLPVVKVIDTNLDHNSTSD